MFSHTYQVSLFSVTCGLDLALSLSKVSSGERQVLRITEERNDEDGLVLQLEGQLVGPWVKELDRLCEESVAHGQALTIDLAAVSFADRHGISLLKNLRGRGTPVLNGSPFLREQLNDE